MFEQFETTEIKTEEASIFLRWCGSGPPILLLHGFPQTHLMWHSVAPLLADQFTVVCADLRGYGRSSCSSSSSDDHAPYSKRAMAHDMIAMMAQLGFSSFSVAGHDRGGRVAYRLALDHPKQVERLAVFDIVPTEEAWKRADARFAIGYWPWSLLAQPEPLPERLLAAAPDAIIDDALGNWGSYLVLRCGKPIFKRLAILCAFMQSAKNIGRLQHSTDNTIRPTGKLAIVSSVRCLCFGAVKAH